MNTKNVAELEQLLSSHRETARALHRQFTATEGDICLNCGTAQDQSTLWVLERCLHCNVIRVHHSARRLSGLLVERGTKAIIPGCGVTPEAPALDFMGIDE